MARVEQLRSDLRRTEERLNRADELGDFTARAIAESRLRRLRAELEVALGIQRPTTSTARLTARHF